MLRLLEHIRDHRYLIGNFVERDLKVKYRGTVFGYFWSLLEPAALVGIYYFVFVVIAQRGEGNYPLIVMLGLLPWIYFSSVIQGATNALRVNAQLVRKVQIPRDVYIMAASASSLVVLLLNMLAVLPLLFIYRVTPGPTLILWIPAMLMLTMMAVGIGLVTSCANVIFKDVSYLLNVIIRIGLYFSATVYPVSMVPANMRYWFLFNPVALCLTMGRSAFLGEPMPFHTVHWVSALLVALISCSLGAAIFFRWEKKAVKFL